MAACVLWLLGVEVLPAIHIADHGHDHDHDAAGTIVRTVGDDGTHVHGSAAHSHRRDVELELVRVGRAKLPTDQLAFTAPEAGHEATGLAHHATALLQPPPPVLAPLPVEPNTWWVVSEPIERLDARHAARPIARGPPV
jgi:hypothetical protein